jgi:hypothetical protein
MQTHSLCIRVEYRTSKQNVLALCPTVIMASQPAHAYHSYEFTLFYFHSIMSLHRKVRHVANWPYASL